MFVQIFCFVFPIEARNDPEVKVRVPKQKQKWTLDEIVTE